MRVALLEQVCCPTCRGSLRLESGRPEPASGRVETGVLCCVSCRQAFPIVRGVPRFVPGESYTASFGRQWTRYAVENLEEDERTFETKTGVSLSELRGLEVLDAGCGGGRYSFVAAHRGARVLAVDMSRAVDRAARLCSAFDGIDFVQADLTRLPVRRPSVDLAFSIGVLHHSNDPEIAFRQVAATVRPRGRLAVWLYRRNTAVQERLNHLVRGITRRLGLNGLEVVATLGALAGSVPVLNRTINKLVNFSNHPDWNTRVCDTFDWYSPRYQSHHTLRELEGWFRSAGFGQLRELPPAREDRFYRGAYERNLIIGSGVNMVGVREG